MATEADFRSVVERMLRDEEEHRHEIGTIGCVILQKYQGMLTTLIDAHFARGNTLAPGRMDYMRRMREETEERQRQALQEMERHVVHSEEGTQFFLCVGGPADQTSVPGLGQMPEGAYTPIGGAVYQRKGMTLVFDDGQTQRFLERQGKAPGE